MGGGLMQLVALGAQDVYLTGIPQITFWKTTFGKATMIEEIPQVIFYKVKYERHSNFDIEIEF